jgi:hypothetical protein
MMGGSEGDEGLVAPVDVDAVAVAVVAVDDDEEDAFPRSSRLPVS